MKKKPVILLFLSLSIILFSSFLPGKKTKGKTSLFTTQYAWKYETSSQNVYLSIQLAYTTPSYSISSVRVYADGCIEYTGSYVSGYIYKTGAYYYASNIVIDLGGSSNTVTLNGQLTDGFGPCNDSVH